MKKRLFVFLSVVVLYTGGCFRIENTDDIFSYRLPGVMLFTDMMDLALHTKAGSFLAPDLENKIFSGEIGIGDLLYTIFTVNFSLPPTSSGLYSAYDIYHAVVNTASPSATVDGASETDIYDFPIKDIAVLDFWNYYLYFAIDHQAPETQQFDFEMTYDINETANIPTVYLRAGKIGEEIPSTGSTAISTSFFAFNMTELTLKFMTPDNRLYINIKFRTGVDNDGNEVFTNFAFNPVFMVFD